MRADVFCALVHYKSPAQLQQNMRPICALDSVFNKMISNTIYYLKKKIQRTKQIGDLPTLMEKGELTK